MLSQSGMNHGTNLNRYFQTSTNSPRHPGWQIFARKGLPSTSTDSAMSSRMANLFQKRSSFGMVPVGEFRCDTRPRFISMRHQIPDLPPRLCRIGRKSLNFGDFELLKSFCCLAPGDGRPFHSLVIQ
ncbi:hypothetical protein CDAR_584921 [Caerostris darwini]|uniref:Uncharacterized protein n=1 Tax=Caerostris darwini TaxID=1538125 RepID=A0AAV4UDJ6_9ARAC|nr:hypothetical protein CDAR_584921 [Caerostris darwini]